MLNYIIKYHFFCNLPSFSRNISGNCYAIFQCVTHKLSLSSWLMRRLFFIETGVHWEGKRGLSSSDYFAPSRFWKHLFVIFIAFIFVFSLDKLKKATNLPSSTLDVEKFILHTLNFVNRRHCFLTPVSS